MSKEGVISIITNFGTLNEAQLSLVYHALRHLPKRPNVVVSNGHPELGLIVKDIKSVHHNQSVSDERLIQMSETLILLYDLNVQPFTLLDYTVTTTKHRTLQRVYYVFQK